MVQRTHDEEQGEQPAGNTHRVSMRGLPMCQDMTWHASRPHSSKQGRIRGCIAQRSRHDHHPAREEEEHSELHLHGGHKYVNSLLSGAHAACRQACDISRPEVKLKLAAGGARTHRAQHRDEALRDQEREQPADGETTACLIISHVSAGKARCTTGAVSKLRQRRASQVECDSQVDADVDALSSRPRLQRVDLRWDLRKHDTPSALAPLNTCCLLSAKTRACRHDTRRSTSGKCYLPE